ncbi:MAG: hypothetical protein ABH986_06945 [archaeon]
MNLKGGENAMEKDINQKNLIKNMNEKGQNITTNKVLGFLILFFGAYMLFVLFNIVTPIPGYTEFLINSGFSVIPVLQFIIGVILVYFGYNLLNEA